MRPVLSLGLDVLYKWKYFLFHWLTLRDLLGCMRFVAWGDQESVLKVKGFAFIIREFSVHSSFPFYMKDHHSSRETSTWFGSSYMCAPQVTWDHQSRIWWPTGGVWSGICAWRTGREACMEAGLTQAGHAAPSPCSVLGITVTWPFGIIQAYYFGDCSSLWVCLLFPGD